MTINLSNYKNIETALFVNILCEHYKATPSANATVQTLTFSSYDIPQTINGNVYTPLGGLMNITTTSTELRSAPGEATITVSGIPNTSIAEIVNSKIKGSKVVIYRAFFDSDTRQMLNIAGNPMGKFTGQVVNYNLNEEFDNVEGVATTTIDIQCASVVETMSNKITGRRTNPIDQKKFYPSDKSFDRVLSLAKSNFNFGRKT